MKLSIVIPAYDEEARLPATLERIDGYLAAREGASEVIVVDDGSRDGTAAAAESVGATVLRNGRNRGKGYSVRHGLLEATGDLILMTDADLSTPIEDLALLEQALGAGADIAIGSRSLPGSDVQVPQPPLRRLTGRVFGALVRAMAIDGFRDTQCVFKLFSRGAARAVFERARLDGFGFDVEALYLARRLGLATTEVPVTWRDVAGSRVSPLRDGMRMFLDLIRIRWLHRRVGPPAGGPSAGGGAGVERAHERVGLPGPPA